MRARAGLLLLLFMSSTAFADEATWRTNLADTLTEARSAKAPVLLQVRGNCGGCNSRIDDLLGAAAIHAPIRSAYGDFVLCRLDAQSTLPQPNASGDQQLRVPSIALLTPGGFLVTYEDGRDLNAFATFLNRVRTHRARLQQIDELAEEGKTADALMIAGEVAKSIGDFTRAKTLFDRAKNSFEQASEEERAERAGIEADFAVYEGTVSGNMRVSIINRMNNLARTTRYPANAAAIHFHIAQSSAPRYAVDEYRQVVEKADPDSQEARIASRWLAANGFSVPRADSKAVASVIRILKPDRATLTGRVELVAECSADVARVAWFQDGVAVASSSSVPFIARLDLGSVPRLHSIKARAFNAAGYAVGVSEIAINDRLDAFRVSLVSPAESKASGTVTVEAEAQPPAGSRLESVALLWNDQTIASMASPPYKATFDIPKEFGFLRAVATLNDGRIAEDTKPMNERTFSMPVNVHEIVLPVTVTERDQPVNGLSAADFAVVDAGVPVPAVLQSDDASTIGIAVDSSTSISRSLVEVMELAADMIDTTVAAKDEAFLMAFDERPFMMQMATSDAARLKDSVYRLAPFGSTSLYDAIAFGLQQFTGLPGRRALVVVTDGLEVRSGQTSHSCERMAREIGVPIYIIVTRIRTGARGTRGVVTEMLPGEYSRQQVLESSEDSLERITKESGGAIFYAPTPDEQRKIFTRIGNEVRSQYLLAFTAPEAKAGTWRTVKVDVPKAKGKVRTIAGYFAR